MKKVLKRVVSLILSMILVLGVWQTPVYAWDDNGQGNAGGGGSLNLNGKDGINPFKAGWLLWVSDESGHPILGKPVTAVSAGGYEIKTIGLIQRYDMRRQRNMLKTA